MTLPPCARYVTPLLFLIAFSMLPDPVQTTESFWVFYSIKITLTLLLAAALFRDHWTEISSPFDVKAVGVGLLVLLVWLSFSVNGSLSPDRFDPSRLNSTTQWWFAVTARLIGATLVMPVAEELVWRGFLVRWLVRDDFLSVPHGTYTHLSFWVTVITFTLMHAPWQWPLATFAGIAYGVYLVKTHNFSGCIIAHATTNFGLSLYIIFTHQWWLWV